MNKKIDYLIVGQGLAGTFLAFQLLQKGKSFLVIDKGHDKSSSSVAAGIINPMVLKRLTISWRAKEFLDYNSSFYNGLEQLLNKTYFFNIPMDKLISSKDDALYWTNRFDKIELDFFAEKKLIDAYRTDISKDFFKYGRVKHTSWVNIGCLLKDFRSYLMNNELLVEGDFNHSQLQEKSYGNIIFDKVVFCEGANAKKNPLFNTLPFSLNKGQLITIKSEKLSEKTILKKKVFILPYQQNEFKVGSTFSWKWDNELAEQSKTEELREGLAEIIGTDYEILSEYAGIRPSSRDRRPLIGRHAQHKNCYLFNGMGAKGCLMAPLLSQEFYDFIENGKDLHPEANIDRFKRS